MPLTRPGDKQPLLKKEELSIPLPSPAHELLEKIPASRASVELLYAQGKISRSARDYALEQLYPMPAWGVWASSLFLIFGTTLTLTGIGYFFAFNWAKLSWGAKFLFLESGIAGSVLGAFYVGLRRLAGQLLLMAGSIGVGVFMAVFGQAYPTGANAYSLFMGWSFLIFPWALVSRFAPAWLLWATVTQVFLILGWQQAVLPALEWEALIFSILGALNCTLLGMREFSVLRGSTKWLAPLWSRWVLLTATASCWLFPILQVIFNPKTAGIASLIGSALGLSGYALGAYFYRFKLPDAIAVIITGGFWVMVLEGLGVKLWAQWDSIGTGFQGIGMAVWTLLLFSGAILYLHRAVGQIRRPYA